MPRQLGKKYGSQKEEVPIKTFTKQEIPLKTNSSHRVQNCLEELEPFMKRVITNDEIKTTDYTDIYNNKIMDEYIRDILN